MDTQTPTDDATSVRPLLRRAYVLMNFGYFEPAIEACKKAAIQADDALVAKTLQGAILTSSGRPREAIQILMPLHQRNREAILTALYLAEACFFAGRHRRAWKVLDGLDEQQLVDSPYGDFADDLRRSWEQLEDGDQSVQPLTVPMDEPPADQ